jgi:hypothetical protein
MPICIFLSLKRDVLSLRSLRRVMTFGGPTRRRLRKKCCCLILLKRARQKLSYTYDFGDNWAHSVTLMKQVAYDPDLAFKCVAGEGACPLEDCGGVYGHQRISEYVKTGVDDGFLPYDDRELGEYDPDLFDMNEVNGLLHNVKEEYREDEDQESGAIYLSNPVGTGDGPVVPLFRSVCLWRLWRVHRSRILKLI